MAQQCKNRFGPGKGTAKEKLLEVASDLFYRQGYNATGIQQIIDEAGVSTVPACLM
jgi:AcrR family transcriptional regulator